MKAMLSKLLGFVVLLVLVAYGYFEVSTNSETQQQPASTLATSAPALPAPGPSQAPQPGDGVQRIVASAAVTSYGKVIYRGPVDLTATIERIRAGVRHPHRNDGSVFGNRERLLPSKPRGYYREYVHPTDGLTGPGPQRVVVGRDGDWWYTPDHYASFIELGKEKP